MVACSPNSMAVSNTSRREMSSASSDPSDLSHLTGDIELRNITVRDDDGKTILEDIDLRIPKGARVAIQSTNAAERTALPSSASTSSAL